MLSEVVYMSPLCQGGTSPSYAVRNILSPLTVMGAAQELDVDTEMQRGMLPGAMALSAKFVPVVQRVSRKTLEAVKEFVADPKALTDKVWKRAVKCLMSGHVQRHQCSDCFCHRTEQWPLKPVVTWYPGSEERCHSHADVSIMLQVQEKVAHVGASVREHVAPDSHSATTGTSSHAGRQSDCRVRQQQRHTCAVALLI